MRFTPFTTSYASSRLRGCSRLVSVLDYLPPCSLPERANQFSARWCAPPRSPGPLPGLAGVKEEQWRRIRSRGTIRIVDG